MKHADVKELEARIDNLVRASAFANRISKVSVEANDDEESSEFLRVFLHFKSKPDVKWQSFRAIVRAIEDEVATVDERFPSVRIAEAA